MADEIDDPAGMDESPTALIPPQNDAVVVELTEGDRELLHCLDCGRQMVARRHGGSCLLCGSAAIIVESV